MKTFFPHLMALSAAILLVFLFESCSSEDFHPKKANQGRLLVADYDNQTPYDIYLLNADKGAIYSMNMDNNFNISNIDVLCNKGNDMVNISLYEDGLVRSISAKDFTFVLSNYEANLVDIAVIVGNEFIMEKAFQCDVNWDNLKISSEKSGTSTRAAGFGANFDDFADRVANGSFHQSLYDHNSVVSLTLNQIKNYIDIGKALDIEKGKEKEVIKNTTRFLIDIVNDGIIDLALDQDDIADIVSTVETAYDVIRNGGNVWDTLLYVLGSYDRWVDLTADLWENFFEWQDERSRREELGIAALNTGSGALKATLSWNFYADIDLYAKEPNGTVIYYYSPYSYYTGGYLDVDNREGGVGATENIYWENPEDGTYEFALDYYGPSIYNSMSQSGVCKVTIMYKGIGRVYDIPMSTNNTKNVTEIILPLGTYTRASVGDDLFVKLILSKKDAPKPE